MIKSNLPSLPNITPEAKNRTSATLSGLVAQLDTHPELRKYLEPGYGVKPVIDNITGAITEYQLLGDPSNAKTTTMSFKLFGQTIEVPVATSVYQATQGQNVVEKTVKTLNFTADQKEMVLETAVSIFKLAQFFTEHMEVQLRGKLPELQNLPQGPNTLPMFGKGFLDLWCANPTPQTAANPAMVAELHALSGEQHLLSGMVKMFLDSKVATYQTMLDVVKSKGNTEASVASVVADAPYKPELPVITSSVINQTLYRDPSESLVAGLNKTADGMVMSAALGATPTKKKERLK